MIPYKRYRLDVKDIAALSLLVILAVLWFYNVVFRKNILIYADLANYFYPIRHFAAESVRSGTIPLWNPFLKSGTPFLATLQPCIFYPLSAIYYLPVSFEGAFNWYIISHFMLAGIFMYALMRDWGYLRPASLLSSIVFIFGGYLNSVIAMNTTLSSVIWLPCVFLFFDRMLRKRSLKAAFIAGIFLSLQFLGGEPTIIYCTAWILLFYAAFFVHNSYRNGEKPRDLRKILALSLVAILSWIAVSAVQLLPFLELLSRSTRSATGAFNIATKHSLFPWEILSFFVPHALGDASTAGSHLNIQYWLISLYAGVTSVIFISLALFAGRSRKVIFFTFLTVLSLILAMGKYTPLYKLLFDYLPGIALIRYPVKYIFITGFSLSVLTGIGLDSFLRLGGKKSARFSRMLIMISGFAGLALIALFAFSAPLYTFFVKYLLTETPGILNRLSIARTVFLSTGSNLARAFIVFSISALSMILYLRKKMGAGTFGFLILAIFLFDLAGVNAGIIRDMDRNKFKKAPQSLLALKGDDGYSRIFRTKRMAGINQYKWGPDFRKGLVNRKETFYCNSAMPYGISDAQGYGSIFRRDYARFTNIIYNREDLHKSGLLDLLNIRYIISTAPIKDKGYDLALSGELGDHPVPYAKKLYKYFCINKKKDSLGRVFLIKKYKVINDEEETLSALEDENFDPAAAVILEEAPLLKERSASAAAGTERTEIKSYKPNEVVIKASLREPKFLVLSDTYYPGWKVFVDGKPDKLYRAYYILKAVHLDKGEHTVRFVFDPLSYKIGKYITLLTLAALALYFFTTRRN